MKHRWINLLLAINYGCFRENGKLQRVLYSNIPPLVGDYEWNFGEKKILVISKNPLSLFATAIAWVTNRQCL